jgi:deoxyguanosine kinase
VEGVIGAGKTTLVELLSKDFHANKYLEIVEENPFLVKGFYDDRLGNAFNTEIFFLLSRFRQQRQLTDELLHSSKFIISDYLFAKNRVFAGLTLKGADLELFDSVFRPLNKKTAIPDLIIYLKSDADNLMKRIQMRDRSFERNMDPDYIKLLVDRYDDFFDHYNETEVLTIDASEVDFVYNLKAYNHITGLVAKQTRRKTGRLVTPERRA